MYTRCTECRTVFHITVAELRAADGRVVCGQCDAEFDALENLSDTLPPPEEPEDPEEPRDEDAPPDDESEPAGARDEEDFLREIESLIVDRERTPDDADEDEAGLPDPDDVFRIDPDEDVAVEGIVISAAPDDEDEDYDAEPGADEVRPAVAGALGAVQAGGDDAHDVQAAPDEDEAPASPRERETEPEARPEPGPVSGPLPLPEEAPAAARWRRVVLGVVILAVVGALWAHSERGRLLRHPAGQAILGPVYALAGVDAAPDWSPGELKILRSATVADPGEPGSLRVSTEFRNAASFSQPYPVLRVTLEDRWGQQVASRDFTPSEYREAHVAGRLMRAGERVQATVSLPDPGARADGFRVDLCLEGPGRRLVCAAEAGP